MIYEYELRQAINSFKSGKSPGLDGIPIEFYKIFFEYAKDPILASFNYSFEVGRLSGTQQEGLISLLLKQEATGQYKDPVK
ncbi:hypothetical protein [Candidatus Ichthyocystis sparus]|uniref:hypothetical protein n=1 Tax=Candidatus Ichthyocystis sparus TaxID=1561004 RepID=UPI000B804C08|nr:hypothetical protein [Candidatus Ichthyocystis sparus]